MSLYLSKVKCDFPKNPKDLMNVDILIEYKSIDCEISIYDLNKYFKNEPFFGLEPTSIKMLNSNDIQMIRNTGFTILWYQLGYYWILFNLDSDALVDFKRDFKLHQILLQ